MKSTSSSWQASCPATAAAVGEGARAAAAAAARAAAAGGEALAGECNMIQTGNTFCKVPSTVSLHITYPKP
jgi:hypothetical protein